ncbi:MAG: DoxX family protein [Acidobacteriaceae bacterium]|nr:DoxX family protein [Acidobacteriaceae bacterium]MBV9502647.1 DoxX family protein [Acidobacteriaceae bacterium]
MKNFFRLSFLPRGYDFALLILRLWIGFSLFLKHGWEKLIGFTQMTAHFPDPIHIGPVPSFAFALLSDAICSLLLFFGLAARWAALIIAINTGVAFALVHKFRFFGTGNGEMPWIYFAAAMTVFIAGPGRFSFDGK